MDEFIGQLSEQSRAKNRIQHHERLPGSQAQYASVELDHRIETGLDELGISSLYQHQVDAISSIRRGQNLVISTPTASGKSLTYFIPGIERAIETGSRALYIAPTRALINDQHNTIDRFIGNLGFGVRVKAAQYTGQQSNSEKTRIRDDEPHFLLTTPDMLHVGILPHSYRLWEWFFRALDLIVIDEIHEYRGIFGSHIALVLRRLHRICQRFGASPQYICCSATIGNPVHLASTLTGQSASSFTLINEDTSATGPRHWLLWNPPQRNNGQPTNRTKSNPQLDQSSSDPQMSVGGRRRSPHLESARLFCDLIQRGYQTIVFTNTRQNAERYAYRSGDLLRERGAHDLSDSVTAYHAALRQDRREEIEGRLKNGSLRGVWSTNALELGIDVGSLDSIILDGYPGTRMEAFQRAGRAGRGTEPSLVVLVGGQDQLDQYLMGNPEAFFEADPEKAVVNPTNDELLPDHVLCAAWENWLQSSDEQLFGSQFPRIIDEFETNGVLERREARPGIRWTYDGNGNPHQSLNLRTIDDREIRLIDKTRGYSIGSLTFTDALRDVHPGAIYYHQGRTYEVTDLQIDRGQASLVETTTTAHTRALRKKDVTIEEVIEEKELPDFSNLKIRFANITLRERIESYLEYADSGDDGTRIELAEPLPEMEMSTKSLYFTIPEEYMDSIRSRSEERDGFAGAIHAVEHAMISMLPIELLCDRRDIGGLSTPIHQQTNQATIFIHDGYPGGVALARGGYAEIDSLFTQTQELIRSCPCEAGCPACIQSPHCGNANSPLSKTLALELLDLITNRPNKSR